jgi:hypothetical protein
MSSVGAYVVNTIHKFPRYACVSVTCVHSIGIHVCRVYHTCMLYNHLHYDICTSFQHLRFS